MMLGHYTGGIHGMKKIYERPALIKKGNLKAITAATNGMVVTSNPIPQ